MMQPPVASEPARVAPAPPFDRELAEHLPSVLHRLRVPLTAEGIAQSRKSSAAARLSDEDICSGGAFTLEERVAWNHSGAVGVPLLICRPTDTPGPHPAIYHIHGGGMVSGHARTAELAGDLRRAKELQLAVVAVEYRLAPENPDPAPVEDCYAALCWLHNHAAELRLLGNRIILSGNSAGGGLAAGVSLLARDRGGPELLGQMLQCPMLDDRCSTVSASQMNTVGVWDGRSNVTGWTALLGRRRGTDAVSHYAAPARAADLSGLPPTFIDVGSAEALRDEAISYATRIMQAGGRAELHVWSGAFHSFDQWVPNALISKAAEGNRLSWLRRQLDGNTPEQPERHDIRQTT